MHCQPYYFPPVEVTAEESELLDRLIDELLTESDRQGIKKGDRLVLVAGIAQRIGDPLQADSKRQRG